MNADRINELYNGQIFDKETQKEARERIHWMCAQVAGEKVLDIGCSQGIITLLLGREGFKVTGIDYENNAVDYARKALEKEELLVRQRICFELVDATAMPYAANSFDTVIMGEILEHVTHPEKILTEAWRVLKEGGRAIITVPFGLNDSPDHKFTYYPATFIEKICNFFQIDILEALNNNLIFTGIKQDYASPEEKENVIRRENLRLQKAVEARCLKSEQLALAKATQLVEQSKQFHAKIEQLQDSKKTLEAALAQAESQRVDAIAAKDEEILRLTHQHERQSAEQNEEYLAKLAACQETAGQENELRHQLALLEERLAQQKIEFLGALAEKERALVEQSQQFHAKIEQLKDSPKKLEAALAQAEIQCVDAIAAKDEEILRLTHQHERQSAEQDQEFRAKLAIHQETFAAEKELLITSLAECRRKLEKQEERYAGEIRQLKAHHLQELEAEKADCKRQLREKEDEILDQLALLEEGLAREKIELRAALAKNESVLAELGERHAGELAELATTHSRHLEAREAELEAQAGERESELLSRLTAQMEEISGERDNLVAALTDKVREIQDINDRQTQEIKHLKEARYLALTGREEEFEKRLRETEAALHEATGREKMLVQENEVLKSEFRKKEHEIAERYEHAIAMKDQEISELLVLMSTEIEKKDNEISRLTAKHDEFSIQLTSLNTLKDDFENLLKTKEAEHRAALAGKKREFTLALLDREKLFRESYSWRIGWTITGAVSLVGTLAKNPVQFLRKADSHFKHYYRGINPKTAPPRQNLFSLEDQRPIQATASVDELPVKNKESKLLPIGCIFDEFTAGCFEPEFEMVTFRPDNWRQILEQKSPKAIFVESAWAGNEGAWQYRIAKYAKNMGDELLHLLNWAREHQIPSVFWNKEDPPNYDRFIDKAKEFDYIFTSDSDCIPKYQKVVNHNRVFALPFAAQPSIHNPILSREREHNVCFAGTYYGKDFPERQKDMELILKPALDFDLHIYDRQHGVTGPGSEQFRFPDVYQSAIKGRLNYEAMVEAYKTYRVFLNVNSVKDSPTMFSRRVFELLACGTPVISTYSKGIEQILGNDTVLITESTGDTRRHLEKLLGDEDYWWRLSVRGIRKVMGNHTYRKRFGTILETIDVACPTALGEVFGIIAPVSNNKELEMLQNSLSRQKYKDFTVLILSENKINKKQLERLQNRLPGKEIICRPISNGIDQSLVASLNADLVAIFRPEDYYGENYLIDYALAAQYSTADYFGKEAHFDGSAKPILQGKSREFRFGFQAPVGSLAMRTAVLDFSYLPTLLRKDIFRMEQAKIFSLDHFNFCKSGSVPRKSINIEAVVCI